MASPRVAARRGIPAVAFSQDNRGTMQFPATARLAADWLKQHRAQLSKKPKVAPTTITSYNVPNCPSGKPRGVLKVSPAPDLANYAVPLNCAATGAKPTTDVDAYNQGYAAVTQVPLND
jgi:5'/3'-nucleotidase